MPKIIEKIQIGRTVFFLYPNPKDFILPSLLNKKAGLKEIKIAKHIINNVTETKVILFLTKVIFIIYNIYNFIIEFNL